MMLCVRDVMCTINLVNGFNLVRGTWFHLVCGSTSETWSRSMAETPFVKDARPIFYM